MAMATLVYNSFVDDLNRGAVNPNADSFKAMIVLNAYTPDKDTHLKRSDVTSEASGTGYTAGGTAVTCTVAKDTALDRVTLTFSNPSWAASTITGRGIVIYKSRGGAATADELVAAITNSGGIDVSSTNGTWTFTFTAPLTFQN
jgi:hypothetical protein